MILALLGCAHLPPEAPPPPPEPPRVVALVVVDQLTASLYEAVRPHVTGGFARLERGWRATAEYPWGCTVTAVGHATISTGASPNVHGIPHNRWLEGGQPVRAGDPALLRAETLADVVAEAGGKVLTLSLKERAARILGGRTPTEAVWPRWDFAGNAVRFEGPSWLPDADRIAALQALEWTATRPWPGLDDDPIEQDIAGYGRTFPHPPATNVEAFFSSPHSGTLLTDAALAGVDALGLGDDSVPDLLGISYSHVDGVGHTFTPASHEAKDALLRLDAELERLFAALDARVGPGKWAAILTSDHGGNDRPIGWLDGEKLAHELGVTFQEPGFHVPEADVPRVVEALAKVPGIAVAAPKGSPEGAFAAERAACFVPDRVPDVIVVPAEGWIWKQPELGETGSDHGTPWPYDRVVPILALGPSAAPAGTVDPRQVAPTLARWMGLRAPANAELPPLP
ncbi:MAG: alkaline phosphatase family protein [Myxococcota bacterium]